MEEYVEYKISVRTMSLEQVAHERIRTKIKDRDGIFYTTKSVKELLEEGCNEDCSTVEGKRKAVTRLFRMNQKTPLPINIRKCIYAFPTTSPEQDDCIWIFLNHIERVDPITKSLTLITFKNNEKLEVPVSEYTIEQQRNKTSFCMAQFAMMEHPLY